MFLAVLSASAAQPKGILPGVRRIVFVGDSITYGGKYIEYFDAFLATRYPERRIEIINLGLPSETVSGLSEPGHAAGKFPRPDLHERLDRVLQKTKPDLVIACYGMNDGIYHPFGEERFKAYREGMLKLRAKVANAGAKIIHITPPVFDPVPIKDKTLPAGRDEYASPYEGYNEVLDRYAAWLLQQRKQGWQVVDLHEPMNRHLAMRRAAAPEFLFARDGVHANETGHLLFAVQLLDFLRVPAEVDMAVIDAKRKRVQQGRVEPLKVDAGGIRFTWRTRLPLPMDSKWDADSVKLERVVERFNQHRLVVKGANADTLRLFEGDKLLGSVTRVELEQGIDLLRFTGLSSNQRAAELMKLVTQRQVLIKDAWLSDVGHLRPGMRPGVPLAEATRKAEELAVKVRQLAEPVGLELRLSAP
ncbi:MAG: SGNH/GDSL hydrolase family protein [Verrucomicrobiota bacterium]